MGYTGCEAAGWVIQDFEAAGWVIQDVRQPGGLYRM